MQAELICSIPPTLNDQINVARSGVKGSARIKRQWTNHVAAISYSLPKFPGAVWLDFLWMVNSKRFDPDNVAAAAKYVMDGLVSAGVLVGDSLTIVQSPVVHRYEKGANELKLSISDRPIYNLSRCRDSGYRDRDLIPPVRERAEMVKGVSIE